MTALESYLGAARVVRVASQSVLVALEEASDAPLVQATPALTFPYRCALGDQLLVIGDARAFFIIGVLAGRGTSSLPHASCVSLRADGQLRLVGERGVRVTGERVRLEAERLRRLAVDTVQTFGELSSRVRERLRVDAGQLDELSQGRWLLQARTVVIKSLEKARIKSSTVRVG